MQTRLDIILETVSYILENSKLGWRKRRLYYSEPSIDPVTDELNPNWRGSDPAADAMATYGRGSPQHLVVAPIAGLQMRRDRLRDLLNKNPSNEKIKKQAETAHSQFWKALTGTPSKSTGHVMVRGKGGKLKRKR